MPKGYWIAFYRSISDPAAMAEYAKLAGPAIQAAGGKFLARATAAKAYDNGVVQRTVLVEFPSVAAAVACHDSPAYAEALRAFGNAADRDLRIVEGGGVTMKLDVKDKRVVVAGGSRGIGRSIAIAFAQCGARVSICARGAETLEATRKEIAAAGPFAHAETCDLASEKDIARYIPSAAAALGGIDVLVNNATAAGMGDDEASWEASLAVDLMAGVRASRFALPWLAKGREPTIINMASGSGLNPSVRTPAYGASKAAIIHYTRTQAAALAMKGIRVNCVAPGSIEFPGGFWEKRKTTETALYNQVLASMPAGRLGHPEEVASVVLFLASPLAIWVTAQIIGVSGGQGFATK